MRKSRNPNSNDWYSPHTSRSLQCSSSNCIQCAALRISQHIVRFSIPYERVTTRNVWIITDTHEQVSDEHNHYHCLWKINESRYSKMGDYPNRSAHLVLVLHLKRKNEIIHHDVGHIFVSKESMQHQIIWLSDHIVDSCLNKWLTAVLITYTCDLRISESSDKELCEDSPHHNQYNSMLSPDLVSWKIASQMGKVLFHFSAFSIYNSLRDVRFWARDDWNAPTKWF